MRKYFRQTRQHEQRQFYRCIVQAFIAEWDGFDKQQTVLVLGATNRRDIMDEAVLSRFAEQIEIPLPDAAMRQSILPPTRRTHMAGRIARK